MKVDYTKSLEPVHLVDGKKTEKKEMKKPDISAIFSSRQQPTCYDDVNTYFEFVMFSSNQYLLIKQIQVFPIILAV